MLGAQASSNGSQRLPMAGRCHGGTGRENSARPTSLRNSLCNGLWVSASLDIIRHWNPDVELSCGTFQSELTKLWVFNNVGRRLFFLFSFFLNMTGNKLTAETIRRDGGGEQRRVDLFNMSDRGECTRGLLHFGEFFLFLRPLRLLIPKELLCWKNVSRDQMYLDGWTTSSQFCDLRWTMTNGKTTTKHLLLPLNDLFFFYIVSRLKPELALVSL